MAFNDSDLSPELRLATYGTLAPGRENATQLNGLSGKWARGHVRGHLTNAGWGSAAGYPGIIVASDGPLIEVEVFTSFDLPEHWVRLDEFEGIEYRRVVVSVQLHDREVPAFIYALT